VEKNIDYTEGIVKSVSPIFSTAREALVDLYLKIGEEFLAYNKSPY
jgi:hypothetical protein